MMENNLKSKSEYFYDENLRDQTSNLNHAYPKILTSVIFSLHLSALSAYIL